MGLLSRRSGATVAVALAVLLTGCSGAASGTAQQGYVDGAGTIQVVPAAERAKAPALKGTTLDGKPFDLASLRGTVVVLNVWASWCPPCRAEGPMLQTVHTDLLPRGGTLVGIDTRDGDGTAARAFAQNIGMTYPSVVDRDGRLLLAFADTLPPQAVPSTLVIDRSGRIAARVIGPVTQPRLMALVDPLLAETAG
jgi:peroxiredoxin